MIIDGDGKHFFSLFLPDYIFIEFGFDFLGFQKPYARFLFFLFFVAFENLFTYIYALVADIHAVRTRYKFFGEFFGFSAERAEQVVVAIVIICHIFSLKSS